MPKGIQINLRNFKKAVADVVETYVEGELTRPFAGGGSAAGAAGGEANMSTEEGASSEANMSSPEPTMSTETSAPPASSAAAEGGSSVATASSQPNGPSSSPPNIPPASAPSKTHNHDLAKAAAREFGESLAQAVQDHLMEALVDVRSVQAACFPGAPVVTVGSPMTQAGSTMWFSKVQLHMDGLTGSPDPSTAGHGKLK